MVGERGLLEGNGRKLMSEVRRSRSVCDEENDLGQREDFYERGGARVYCM